MLSKIFVGIEESLVSILFFRGRECEFSNKKKIIIFLRFID